MKIGHKFLWIIYIVSIIISIICGFLYRYVSPPENHFIWDTIPNFYALFGFFGSIIFLTISQILKRALAREKDYYKEKGE